MMMVMIMLVMIMIDDDDGHYGEDWDKNSEGLKD